MDSLLKWLERWYRSKCDGEWEHGSGVRIDTLDNPGWSVFVDVGPAVDGTLVDVDRNSGDWVYCEVKDNRFCGYGGPGNLVDILTAFRAWVEASEQSGK